VTQGRRFHTTQREKNLFFNLFLLSVSKKVIKIPRKPHFALIIEEGNLHITIRLLENLKSYETADVFQNLSTPKEARK